MRDPLMVGRWALGCMDTKPIGAGQRYTGRSLFADGEGFFEIDADARRLIIDYLVGGPDRLVPRISARIIPADVCDLNTNQCLVTLTAWRPRAMDSERWQRLCASHEIEILLIKSLCEATQPAATVA